MNNATLQRAINDLCAAALFASRLADVRVNRGGEKESEVAETRAMAARMRESAKSLRAMLVQKRPQSAAQRFEQRRMEQNLAAMKNYRPSPQACDKQFVDKAAAFYASDPYGTANLYSEQR